MVCKTPSGSPQSWKYGFLLSTEFGVISSQEGCNTTLNSALIQTGSFVLKKLHGAMILFGTNSLCREQRQSLSTCFIKSVVPD